jgi:hypothetical protein
VIGSNEIMVPDSMSDRVGIVLRDLAALDVGKIASAAETTGFTHLFVPELGHLPDGVSGRDPFLCVESALAATSKLLAGTGVAATIFRTPLHMAVSAATVNEKSNGRFLLGCGVSHRSRADSLGTPFPRSPLAHAAAYCDRLRELSRELGYGRGFPVVLGAMGEKMTSIAAMHADGAMFTWLSASRADRLRTLVQDIAPPDSFSTYLIIRVGPRKALLDDVRTYYQRFPQLKRHLFDQGITTPEDAIQLTCLSLDDSSDMKRVAEQYRSAGISVPCFYPTGMTSEQIAELLATWTP